MLDEINKLNEFKYKQKYIALIIIYVFYLDVNAKVLDDYLIYAKALTL